VASFLSTGPRYENEGIGLIAICAFAATSYFGLTTSEAATLTFDASLSGANESPPNASPGIGFAIITLDTVLNTMEVNVTFSGLTSGDTASHIHCCVAPGGNAGVATTTPTFTAFPSGVTAGSYDQVFDMTQASSYNPAFVTNNGGTVATAEAVLFAGIMAGDAYLNIHTTNFPNGEIRGFLTAAAPTPLPAALPLFASGLGALVYGWRRKRKVVSAA
jgi:hypothetical protein